MKCGDTRKPLIINEQLSEAVSICSSPAKSKIIETVFQRFLEALEKDSKFLPASEAGSERQAAGEALLWTRLFLARHYDQLGQTGSVSGRARFQESCGLSLSSSSKRNIIWHSTSINT